MSLFATMLVSGALVGSAAGCAKGSNAERRGSPDEDSGLPDSSVDLTPHDDASVPDAGPSDAATLPADATVELPGDSGIVLGYETREAFCAGEGSPVEVRVHGTADGGATDQICTTGLASRIFRFGICSCSDLSLPGAFNIDAFDSDHPENTNTTGASIGTNGAFSTQGGLRVQGSVVAGGIGTFGVNGTAVRIDGNVRTNANVDISGANISFRRDLWVNGDIAAAGTQIGVSGDVYQPAGRSLSSTLTVGGTAKTQAFTVDEPCGCDANSIVDIAAIVADGKAHNHNTDVGLAENVGLNMQGTGGLTLDCGRFAFSSSNISGAGNTIVAHGRTALFIEGDMEIAGDFGVDLGADGELDIFVSGNLKLNGSGTVGSKVRPAALRFYVAGSETINIKGAMVFAANLYAPNALVHVGGADDIYGSLFARDVEVSGAHDMHYDRAIMTSDGGDKCEPPPPPPTEPPAEPECKNDLDCEPALVCESGECTPVLELL